MTKELVNEFERWLTEREIVDIECAAADLPGTVCGKTMPVEEFLSHVKKGGVYLPESLFGVAVTGKFNLANVLDDTEPDILMKPEFETLRIVPWYQDKTAIVLGDFFNSKGEPVPFAPRQVLRRVLKLYEDEGWLPIIAPEFEFYLISKPQDFTSEFEPPAGRSGLGQEALHPFGLDSVDSVEELFDDLYSTCEAQDIPIGTLTQEAGPAQYEVNLGHGPGMQAADFAFLFKRCVRRVALDHGVIATFMARPYEDTYGSAMHLHQNIIDIKSGRNLFADEKGDTAFLRSHIAGLQKYLPAVMPLIAPYPNSYRRFAPHLSSPINTHWGYDNRSVGLRLPRAEPKARRIENRVPGADVNPYLVVAASLACGYLGMKEGLEPDEPMEGSAYESGKNAFPRSYRDALDAFMACEAMIDVLGAEFVKLFAGIKKYEYDEFDSIITPWEREHLLLNV